MPQLLPQPAPTPESGLWMDEIARVKAKLLYDAEAGTFTWRVKSGRQSAGSRAGSLWPSGYVGIRVGGKTYLAHRLAWAFVHGEWPGMDVDHVNRCPADNRIVNLRLASRSQNMANCGLRSTNTSGVKGVHWSTRKNRWIARVQKNGKHGWVGSFERIEDAAKAARAAYEREFGAFAA